MKRLIAGLLAAAFGALALGAATAKAADGAFTLTLGVSPATITMDQTAVASGILRWPSGEPLANESVEVAIYTGVGCVDEIGYYYGLLTKGDGSYAYTLDPSDFADGYGTYSVQASAGDVDALSPCRTLSVVPALTKPRGEIGVFLCYSKWQVVPGVWPFGKAQELMKGSGYWLPYAVPGNAPFGTNIGDYHLVCNIASTQSVNGSMLGAGANVYSPDVAKAAIGDTFGPFYPVVGG